MHGYPPILDDLNLGPPDAIRPIGGGCIANALVAGFADGTQVFVKTMNRADDMFPAEAAGLGALRRAHAIRVPEVLAVKRDALVLEYIEPGSRSPGFSEDFGRRFARLHRTHAPVCGFEMDNFIGATAQINRPVGAEWGDGEAADGCDWPEFFIERRLRFQARLAEQKGHGSELLRLLARSEARIAELLGEAIEPPSLLHGDLWGGNYLVGPQGEPALIDPAVYYGHREADLAMTRLFGGFDAAFYAAYEGAFPLTPGHSNRLPVYQLYHVINHLNLFGGSYYGQSRRILLALGG